ncbi:rhodanese-like domain-containing protein [Mycoplasmatota bacterium WC44]
MFSPKFESISVQDLKKINKKSINILDVREPSEYEGAHIPNAKNVPLKTLIKSPADYITDKAYIVCQSGSRSKKVTNKLYKKYNVINVTGGTNAYGKEYSLIRKIKR